MSHCSFACTDFMSVIATHVTGAHSSPLPQPFAVKPPDGRAVKGEFTLLSSARFGEHIPTVLLVCGSVSDMNRTAHEVPAYIVGGSEDFPLFTQLLDALGFAVARFTKRDITAVDPTSIRAKQMSRPAYELSATTWDVTTVIRA